MHWSKNPQIRNKVIDKISKSKIGKPIHTSEWKKILSKKMKGNRYLLGKKHSEEWKKRQSLLMIGNEYGFKPGHKPWTTGKKLPDYINKKKSESMKKAYLEGRMAHMEKIWKKNIKHWQGKKNPRWSGGWYIDKYNYKWIHDHKNRWRKEHRVIAEKIIGRDLKRSETIHHIDENKLNNKPKNLYYFPNDSLHKSYHGLKIKPILKSNLHKKL